MGQTQGRFGAVEARRSRRPLGRVARAGFGRRAALAAALAVTAVVALGAADGAAARNAGVVTVSHCTDPALRQAVAKVPAGGTVRFGCDGTIVIDPNQGPIQIPADANMPQDVTLDGTGHHVAISGADQTDLFFVTGGGTVTLRRLTLTHGRLGQDNQHGFASFGGAAIVAANTKLVVDHVAFSHNQVFGSDNSGAGGAIDVFGPNGALTVSDSQFVDNAAECDATCEDGGGGAIGFQGGRAARITRSFFRGNSELGGDGGGAVAGTFQTFGGRLRDTGPITVTGSDFEDNTSTTADFTTDRPGRGGGAIVSFNHPLTVAHTRFAGNTAHSFNDEGPIQGGAIRVGHTDPPAPPVSIADSIFSKNSTKGQAGGTSGGAVSVDSEQLSILGSAFSHNQAAYGGALEAFGDTTINSSRLTDNTASGSVNGTGGGIFTAGPATFKQTSVVDNTPDGCYRFGAGQIVDAGGNVERPGTSCGFAPNPATHVTLSLRPASIPANGTATTKATATVTDAHGTRIPGDTVTFTSSDRAERIGPTTDNGDGTYTATITASTHAGTATITATDTTPTPRPSGTAKLTQTPTGPHHGSGHGGRCGGGGGGGGGVAGGGGGGGGGGCH